MTTPPKMFFHCFAAGVLMWGRLLAGAQTPDRSWPVSEYVRLGVKDPDKFWTASDYGAFRLLLGQLDHTNRAAFPRLDSPRSAPIFARLINPTNTLHCLETALPPAERMKLFQSLTIFLPSILDIYKLSGTDETFHEETIELAHTHLHLLRLAIELDGRPIPGDPNSRPVQVTETSLTPWNAPYADPDSYKVPRKGSFGIVGAHAAVTLGILLPWLGDPTVIPDAERVIAIRYLTEDVPPLWPHIVSSTRKGLMEDLDAAIKSTKQIQVHDLLEKFRKQLDGTPDTAAR